MIRVTKIKLTNTAFAALTAVLLLWAMIPHTSADGPAERSRNTITWNGNVYLNTSTNIPQGTVLIIEAGTTVTLEWGIDIWVHGTIEVRGTDAQPVTFSRATPEDPWGSIHIYSESVNCHIKDAHIFGSEYGVRGDGGTFVIEDSLMNSCKYGLGAVGNSHITVKNTLINNSWYHSIYGQASTVIFNNSVIGTGGEPSMYLTGQSGTGCTVIFINGKYDFTTLDIQDTNTEVYRCWFVGVDVVDDLAEPVPGAQVTFQRNDFHTEYQGLADDGGAIRYITLSQILYKKVGPTTFNPFMLTVEKEGYYDNSSTRNIDSPGIFEIVMYPANEPPELVRDIANFTTFQNAPDKQLADLREFFSDDSTPDDEINYTVNYNSNPNDVEIFVKEKYYLTVNTKRNKLFNGLVHTKVRVSDSEGARTSSNVIYINVLEVPLIPEIRDFPNLELDEDSSLLTAVYLYEYIDDPDTGYENLNIYISRNDHVEKVAVEISGDALRIIPVKDYFGSELVEITASDNNYTVSHLFYVNVTPMNDAPEIEITAPGFGELVFPNMTIEGTASDIDGDTLSLIVKYGGKEMNIPVTGVFVVEVDLSDHSGGEVWVYVKANDGTENSTAVQLKVIVIDILEEDSDGDGCPDSIDDDDDNDGVPDDLDEFPLDPAASVDGDGDGYPEEWNPGQGTGNSTTGLRLDSFPNDKNEWNDNDLDGMGDNSDDFPEDPSASSDSDGDGHPDQWNPGMTAVDSSMGLTLDAFPSDPAASLDADGDGYPDRWNPEMNATDSTTGLELDMNPNDPLSNIDLPEENDDSGHHEGSPGFEILGLIVVLVLFVVFGAVRRRRGTL